MTVADDAVNFDCDSRIRPERDGTGGMKIRVSDRDIGCATTQVDAQEHQKHCRTDPECEHFYSDLSRQSVMSATALQAIRGRELESTMWNHHFVSPTDELTPSGRALLHRLARKDRGMPMQIFIQTANDLPFEDGELLEYSEQINELNKKRAKKVNDYITIVLKQSPPPLFVYDRTPEATPAY